MDELKFWPDDGAVWNVRGSANWLQFILTGTWMSVLNFMTMRVTWVAMLTTGFLNYNVRSTSTGDVWRGKSVQPAYCVQQVPRCTTKRRNNLRSQRMRLVIRLAPWDTVLNVKLASVVAWFGVTFALVAWEHETEPESVSESWQPWPKSVGFVLWGPSMSVQNFMAIHLIIVDTFQSGLKWWTDRLTDQHCHHAASMA